MPAKGLPEKVPQVLGRWHCRVSLSGTGKSFLWNVCVCQTTKGTLRREGKEGWSGRVLDLPGGHVGLGCGGHSSRGTLSQPHTLALTSGT